MAWLPPELDVGGTPELKPLEPGLELELDEPEPTEVEPEPEEAEPEEAEPEEAEDEPDDPVGAEPAPAEDVLAAWVEPGRAKARAPAVATLATVTAVVVDLTLLRPRSRAATARRIPASRRALMSSSCGAVIGNPWTKPLRKL